MHKFTLVTVYVEFLSLPSLFTFVSPCIKMYQFTLNCKKKQQDIFVNLLSQAKSKSTNTKEETVMSGVIIIISFNKLFENKSIIQIQSTIIFQFIKIVHINRISIFFSNMQFQYCKLIFMIYLFSESGYSTFLELEIISNSQIEKQYNSFETKLNALHLVPKILLFFMPGEESNN